MTRGRIVLVTGTDTGVGKTYVACGLVRALRASGRRVSVRKPAETACEPRPTGLWPADAAALREAAASDEPIADVCTYALREPLAPAVAARRAGVEIEVARLLASCREAAARADVLLVEGAGGLLVPLGERYSYADLARELGASLVVVVGARLGAINHALLTLEVAHGRSLDVAGIVVNHFSTAGNLATDTLADTLRAATDVPLLGEVRFGVDPATAVGWFD